MTHQKLEIFTLFINYKTEIHPSHNFGSSRSHAGLRPRHLKAVLGRFRPNLGALERRKLRDFFELKVVDVLRWFRGKRLKLRFLLCKVFIITQKWGRKLTFSYRFSNFVECTRVFAVHIQTKYSSDLPEDGKNSQKMRFDAITGLKTGFRSEAKVNPGSILYSRDRRSLPFRAHCWPNWRVPKSRNCYCFDFGFTATVDS